jgi:hypothetical protein
MKMQKASSPSRLFCFNNNNNNSNNLFNASNLLLVPEPKTTTSTSCDTTNDNPLLSFQVATATDLEGLTIFRLLTRPLATRRQPRSNRQFLHPDDNDHEENEQEDFHHLSRRLQLPPKISDNGQDASALQEANDNPDTP